MTTIQKLPFTVHRQLSEIEKAEKILQAIKQAERMVDARWQTLKAYKHPDSAARLFVTEEKLRHDLTIASMAEARLRAYYIKHINDMVSTLPNLY